MYKRFYWDEENVPFGGTPGFKAQGPNIYTPGKYVSQRKYKSSEFRGGKFNLKDVQEPINETPGCTQYFGLGRSELTDVGVRFDRAERVLPAKKASEKPDYDNATFHKDKGPVIKKRIKGAFFTQAGMA